MKIQLSNNETFNIFLECFTKTENDLTIRLFPDEKDLIQLEETFSDSNNTGKILLLDDAGDTVNIANNYSKLSDISKQKEIQIGYEEDGVTPKYGDVVTIKLKKLDEVEQRLAEQEAQLTDVQMALCEIYETMEV